jgi:hypothetical protein
MRTTLAAVNAELAKRGYTARLAKASGYCFSLFGEAADWLDRTVEVERVSDKSVEEWMAKFVRLRVLNARVSTEPRTEKAKAGVAVKTSMATKIG